MYICILSVQQPLLRPENRFPSNGTCITCGGGAIPKQSPRTVIATKSNHYHRRRSITLVHGLLFGRCCWIWAIQSKTTTTTAAFIGQDKTHTASKEKKNGHEEQLQVTTSEFWPSRQKKFNSIHIRTDANVCFYWGGRGVLMSCWGEKESTGDIFCRYFFIFCGQFLWLCLFFLEQYTYILFNMQSRQHAAASSGCGERRKASRVVRREEESVYI